MFTTKYTKASGKKAPTTFKFAEGGRVPSKHDVDEAGRAVDERMYQASRENDDKSNRFFDSGLRIPGWQAGRNDLWRERNNYKRLKDE
jgi:hypothetical protein